MDPATIEVWEPGRRLRLHGNGVGEEWILEGRDGRTVVRLVFSGYGDADWDETYDAFDDTGALILQLLAAWLDEHGGTPPRRVKAIARLPLDRAAAWAVAFGPAGLAVADSGATRTPEAADIHVGAQSGPRAPAVTDLDVGAQSGPRAPAVTDLDARAQSGPPGVADIGVGTQSGSGPSGAAASGVGPHSAPGSAQQVHLAVGQRVRFALRGGDPVPAVVRMYGPANEAFFAIPEWDNARLLLMVRDADGSAALTFQLTTYGLDPSLVERAHHRLILTAEALEARTDRSRS
jgi:hypothetical protein